MKHAVNNVLKFFKDTAMFIYFLLNLVACKRFFNPIKKKYEGSIAILANGPSLKEVLPRLEIDEEFRNIDFLVMNFFAFEEIFFHIKPKHYCLADPMFFKENHRPERVGDVRKLFDILQNNVDWDLHLYVPSHFSKNFVRFSKITNKKISIVVFNCVEYKGYESLRNIFYKRGLATPYVATVANLAIFACINCGYSKILLYGVDHTFFDFCVDEKNRLCRKETHFYDEGKVFLKPMLNSDGTVVKISRYLEFLADLFKSHDYLSSYAKYVNAEIINCTSCSLIDSYARKPN